MYINLLLGYIRRLCKIKKWQGINEKGNDLLFIYIIFIRYYFRLIR